MRQSLHPTNMYKMIRLVLTIFVLSIALFISSCHHHHGHQHNDIDVWVVYGGKRIDTTAFLQMFESFEHINFQAKLQPQANQLYDSPEINDCDVLVFYDTTQEISEEQKQAFLNLLSKGKGIVFLHHALVSYQNWAEYESIIGGKYYHAPDTSAGKRQFARSTYRHDVDIPVTIVDKNHPITLGMDDFVIFDEVYGNFTVIPSVQPLLMTSHPESDSIIGWTHQFEKSRIVYIQLGHDHNAFQDSNYRKLVRQAIVWASEKK